MLAGLLAVSTGVPAAADSIADLKDPRLIAWANRAMERGRQDQASCNADLAKAGLPNVLSPGGLSSDPDFSREIETLDRAMLIVQQNCVKHSEQAHAALLQDLHNLKLPASEEKILVDSADAGFRKGASEALARLIQYLRDAKEFLSFAQGVGAKWQGQGKGFLYATANDAAKGNIIAARADASRRALLEGARSQ
jgi:hypothetical protein